MIHIRDIDHLVLRIVDLDAMLRFYCNALGCSIERRRDDIGLVQLRAGRSLIDLVPVGGKLGAAGGAAPAREGGRNLDHFCLRVEPFDAAAIRAHLEQHGVAAGAVELRYGAEGEGPSIYLSDPEGNVVELKGPPMQTSRPSDNWQQGNPYERYVGRWSRRVAPEFLSWLAVPAGRRWLDVGCGTGALCEAIATHCAPRSVTGVEPSEGFLGLARATLGARATLLQGSASELPLPDASVDIVVSGLVLNFVPDLRAALREAARVAAPDATFAAYVWDYAGRMELMRHFWDAAVALDPAAATLDEGLRFPLCRPEALVAQLADAGLGAVQTTAIDIPTRFADFDDYWAPFLGGQGPAPAYAMSLDEAARSRLRERLRSRVPAGPDGAIDLIARAWAVRATLPA